MRKPPRSPSSSATAVLFRLPRCTLCQPSSVTGLPCLESVEFQADSLLVGRDFYERVKPDISYSRRTLTIQGQRSRLGTSSGGHLSLDLNPQAYKALAVEQQSKPSSSELPRALRPRERGAHARSGRLARVVSALLACCSFGSTAGQPASRESKLSMQEPVIDRPFAPALGAVSAQSRECLAASSAGRSRMPRLSPSCYSCGEGSYMPCESCGNATCASCLSGAGCLSCASGVKPHRFSVEGLMTPRKCQFKLKAGVRSR